MQHPGNAALGILLLGTVALCGCEGLVVQDVSSLLINFLSVGAYVYFVRRERNSR